MLFNGHDLVPPNVVDFSSLLDYDEFWEEFDLALERPGFALGILEDHLPLFRGPAHHYSAPFGVVGLQTRWETWKLHLPFILEGFRSFITPLNLLSYPSDRMNSTRFRGDTDQRMGEGSDI